MKKILISLLTLGTLTACGDYLDVQPKGVVEDDKQFENVQGFRDAMYGVYASMAQESLYGQQLSWGLLDKLGALFLYDNPSSPDLKVAAYRYTDTEVRSQIDNVWSAQYAVISYVNNIIKHCEETSLREHDINLIHGEAYALRAMLHFDVLRLWTADLTTGGKVSQGIPYSTSYNLSNKTVLAPTEAYQQVLNDLNRAQALLTADRDVWAMNAQGTSDTQQRRYRFMNGSAVRALKARVFFTMGQADSAAHYARLVIDDVDNFRLAAPTATAIKQVSRYPAPGEMIFGLSTTRLKDVVSNAFVPTVTANGQFVTGRRDINTLYDTQSFTAASTDLRYNVFYALHSPTLSQFTRLMSNAQDDLEGLTLIRLPEMYYIYAESIYPKDAAAALAALNAVRASRGLAALPATAIDSREKLVQELLKERMREMPGEGQVFFYLKHEALPISTLDGNTVQPSESVYTLPWPENELEYGNSSK